MPPRRSTRIKAGQAKADRPPPVQPDIRRTHKPIRMRKRKAEALPPAALPASNKRVRRSPSVVHDEADEADDEVEEEDDDEDDDYTEVKSRAKTKGRAKRRAPVVRTARAARTARTVLPDREVDPLDASQPNPNVSTNHEVPNSHASHSAGSEAGLDAHARSLVPASFFGLGDALWQHGLWSLDAERRLRDDFIASPQYARFHQQQHRLYTADEPSGAYLREELLLNDILAHRFRARLDDLFRHGLRPDPRRPDGRPAPYPSLGYLRKLAVLLASPLWAPTHLAHVRWLLQRLVQRRVPGHVDPPMPPYAFVRHPFAAVAHDWALNASRPTRAHADAAAAEADLEPFLFLAHAPHMFFLVVNLLRDDPVDSDDDDSDLGDTSPLRPSSAAVRKRIGSDWVWDSRNIPEHRPPIGEDEVRFMRNRCADEHDARVADRLRRRGLPSPPPADTSADTSTDEQRLFFLHETDLDAALALLTTKELIDDAGLAAPECYYAGYKMAHEKMGYGPVDGGVDTNANDLHGHGDRRSQDKTATPRLTCLVCARLFHQGLDSVDTKTVHNVTAHACIQEDPTRAVEGLLQRKCEWLLAGLREARINAELAKNPIDSPAGAMAWLPDVSPFDPVPGPASSDQFSLYQRASAGRLLHPSAVWCLRSEW